MSQNTWKMFSNPKDNGFTLLELLVVIFMVGALAAITAPSWFGFMRNQRLNKANELVFAALQQAQREAKKDKRNYSVSFRVNSGVYQYSVDSGTKNWKNLTQELGIQPGEIIVGTNLNTPNTVTSTPTVVFNNLATEKEVIFDHMGTLPNANLGTPPSSSEEAPGLRIVVAIPQSTNSTTASNSKRCVIVQTLLGGMRTARDNACS
jgi:type II secretion system protein H